MAQRLDGKSFAHGRWRFAIRTSFTGERSCFANERVEVQECNHGRY